MSKHIYLRAILAAFIVGATLLPQWCRADESAEPSAQAAPATPATPTSAIAPTLDPEEAALRLIQEDGQRQVAALVEQLAGLQPGPALEALQARVIQVKQDTLVRLLTERARLDRTRGDEAAARTAEQAIEQILHPAPPPEEAGPQLPDKTAGTKGGRS